MVGMRSCAAAGGTITSCGWSDRVPLAHRARIVAAGVALVALAVLAFLAFAGTGHSGNPRQQLGVWVKNTGLGPTVGGLRGDAAAITAVVRSRRGGGAIRTTCAVLVDDASSATSDLPAPDTEVTQLLARGYRLEYRAGNDCYTAGATNGSLLARSARERAEGLALLDRALAVVARRTGSPVATTTTTAVGSGGLFG